MSDDLDPDRPIPGDPPINSLSMLEVAEEMHARAAAMREAAVHVKQRYALRAVIDGHNPREVAEACGFDLNPHPPQGLDQMEVVLRQMMPGVFFERLDAESHSDGPERFARWMAESVVEIVRENWR